MNKRAVLENAQNRLISEVSASNISKLEALPISPWVAMSLLQKAIRRSEVSLALRAAATLLQSSPERLWRRLGCIAFEDIGLGDLDVVSLATAALSGKRFRARLGGEWQVASCLVTRLSLAPQCRAADDLLLTAEQHPNYSRVRNAFSEKSTADLIKIATSSADMPVRAIAAWYAVGTAARPSFTLFERKGDPDALFDWMCETLSAHRSRFLCLGERHRCRRA